MICQVFFPSKGLVAVAAPVRRLSRMLAHMVGEVLLACKRLAAVGALMRRLSSVLAHMVHYGKGLKRGAGMVST